MLYSGRHHIPLPALIGDIGGTNARFAVVEDLEGGAISVPKFATGAFSSLEEALEQAVLPQLTARPRAALLAIAGPVRGGVVHMTNKRWTVEAPKLAAKLGLEHVGLLNDFEAIALSLPDLGPDDLDPIGGGRASSNAPRVALGPGTGLGAAALIRAKEYWVPIATEAGHIDFGPATERDYSIWPHLEPVYGRVSAETVLCGPGLVRLYRAISAAKGHRPELSSPERIVAAAKSTSDKYAVEAIHLFASLLGRFAGDLALIYAAFGGVFVAGGIAAHISSVLKEPSFRRAFEAKPPQQSLLEQIPLARICHPNPAIAGLQAAVRNPERFAL